MTTRDEVGLILHEVLQLGGQGTSLKEDTPLLGAIPELDSMAVVTILTLLEERFGFEIRDDGIEASDFSTVGTLVSFVEARREGP